MSRNVTINYAEIPQSSLSSVDNKDGTVTFTAYYVVGNKAADGTVAYYSQKMATQNVANGVCVVVTVQTTDTYEAIAGAIEAAIAAQEGLTLTGSPPPDSIKLP